MTIAYETHESTTTTAYMFGRDSYYDGPCARVYDPWEHAAGVGVPIVYRTDLPDPEMVACYSELHRAIFVRPNLHQAVERCAVAHELVHWENGDVGQNVAQERRADRIAARRLVMPRQVARLADETNDLGRMALTIEVTEHIMAVFMREFAASAA
ncbi:MAG: ImmA/IrrE family metallo-endopeptidase [Pseudolysinimonas sp.]